MDKNEFVGLYLNVLQPFKLQTFIVVVELFRLWL
jgi:hypothetical protein